MSSGSPEQSYAVLSHLHLLVMRAPFIFSSDYKHFYCQYNEPSYVKKLKLEMLTAVANESNTYEIGKKRPSSSLQVLHFFLGNPLFGHRCCYSLFGKSLLLFVS